MIFFSRPQPRLTPTRCKPISLPCHGMRVYLVQRGRDSGPLTWDGVPCLICGATATTENDEDRSGWESCEDVHPWLETVHCWCLP